MTDIAYSRKERSISSWSSIGSMLPSFRVPCTPSSGMSQLLAFSLGRSLRTGIPGPLTLAPIRLHVEEAHVLRVLLDETLARLDVVTHQRQEHLVGDRGFLDRHAQQRAGCRVHRGLAEFLPVHLCEALESVDLDLAVRVRGLELAQRRFVLEVGALLADVGAEQRRLRDVDEFVLH